jgi:hypothetical protein
MPKRPTTLTAAAGEHFVAYKLSELGFLAALTRAGVPTVDIMAGDTSGENSIMIQVKTSNWARRQYKRNTEKNGWTWDVGAKAKSIKGENIIYAFVDLRWNNNSCQNIPKPDVFIVPSIVVANFLGENWSRYMFWIFEKEKDKYFENWDLIIDRLKGNRKLKAL